MFVLVRFEGFQVTVFSFFLWCGLFYKLYSLMLFMLSFARGCAGRGVGMLLMSVEGCTHDQAVALAVLGMEVDQGPEAPLAVRLASQHRDERGRRSLNPLDADSFARTVMVIAEDKGLAFACTLSVSHRKTLLAFWDGWCVSAFQFPLPANMDLMRAAWFIWQHTIRRAVSDDARWQSKRTIWI